MCIMCWCDSWKHKYCYDCNAIRSNACSVIKQNTDRMLKLFNTKRYNIEWFEKFELYISNIEKNIWILKKFIEVDIKRKLS